MTKTQVVLIDPKEYGLEELKASQIEQSFAPKLVERNGYVAVYEQLLTKEISKEVSKEAGELRKKLVKVRTGIADIHKTEKAFYLASGRYVDALKNKLTLPIEQMEEQLASIEKHFEIIEKKRIQDLHNSRLEMIIPYVDDTTGLSFGTMQDDVFEAYLTAKKQAHADKIAAELKAEQERIEREQKEAAEREAQRLENERLKKEADEREKQIAAERAEAARKQKELDDKLAAEKVAADEALRIEREKADAERKRIEAENEVKLAAERAERERIEAELKAKQDSEIKAAKEKADADAKAAKEAEKLAKAPIKKQLSAWVEEFLIPKSEISHETKFLIEQKFESFRAWAKIEVEKI
jgi:hypothetical protein